MLKAGRIATISFKGSDSLDATLRVAAEELNFRSKSDLLNDVLTDWVAQLHRQDRPFSRLQRAERTRQIAIELADLWLNGPQVVERKRSA
jgi:hypothetical protein